MSLKEFDAKQFLLQKGEQVGLGIALTLMVLMLIFSLFMPSKGFFSGSPAAKAEPLAKGAKDLQNALNTREPPDSYKAPDIKGRRIDLDTAALDPRFYEMTSPMFEPTAPENPDRRPPQIFNIVEAIAKPLYIPIDTYIFSRGREGNYDGIYVLHDKEHKAAANAAGGANNPLAKMYGGSMPKMPSGPGGSGGMQTALNRFKGPNRAAGGVQGADGKEEYDVVRVPLTNVSMSEHFARQLTPARMVIVEGSFPYKEQLDEFRKKLRLDSVQEVLNETVKVESEKDKKEEQLASFRFLGVEVQRSEVDAGGKTIEAWKNLDLDAPYKVWLMNSSLPFEQDDPKYDVLKFASEGLMMPLLREFHEKSQQPQMGMMMPGMPQGGSAGPRPNMDKEEPRKPGKSKYEDLAKDLKTISDTLSKLAGVKPKQLAVTPAKFRGHETFKPFSSSMPTPAPEGAQGKDTDQGKPGETIPEYCLVRVVDLDIVPGKFYRYRFKIRMGNPNYGREDVASTTYKKNEELKSNEWWELKETVSVPPESVYYVVDQKKLSGKEKPATQSPQWEMWRNDPSRDGSQVVFQLHRWIDSAPIAKDGEPVPIGEWAIADRVFVSRGDFIGQTVKVDLPVWKYSQDSFVLPAEDQSRKAQAKGKTGVHVNFGADNADKQTILVDFEGGSQTIRNDDTRLSDTSGIEVLMLSPDGKLRARNSSEDANDEERKERREKVQDRVKEVREGKTGGAGGGSGGLDAGRSKK